MTNLESFIQAPKTASKNNSADKLEDKRRHEEDALKKRKEALRLLTEEKRRYEEMWAQILYDRELILKLRYYSFQIKLLKHFANDYRL